jgi:hypothetical protein
MIFMMLFAENRIVKGPKNLDFRPDFVLVTD